MGKQDKRNNDGGDNSERGGSPEKPIHGESARNSEETPGVRRGRGRKDASRRSWLATHGRDLRFLVVFAFLMGLYYTATTTTFAKETFFPSYLRLNAQAAGAILDLSGYDVTVRDTKLIEPRFSVEIGRGCDAVEPSALFVAAVLASPVALAARLAASVVGTLLLMAINLTRVITLLLTGIYAPRAFDVMHLEVWQALFIFLAIVFWAVWASREARKRQARRRNANT